MTDNDLFDIELRPPHLVVEVNISEDSGLSFELEYELVEILDIAVEDEEEVEIIDAHWHGIVIEDPEGETHHIDLRELDLEDENE